MLYYMLYNAMANVVKYLLINIQISRYGISGSVWLDHRTPQRPSQSTEQGSKQKHKQLLTFLQGIYFSSSINFFTKPDHNEFTYENILFKLINLSFVKIEVFPSLFFLQ